MYVGRFASAVRQDTVEAFAEQAVAQWRKLADHEFRDGPTGKVWVERCRVRPGVHGPGTWRNQQVMRTSYHAKFPHLLVVEFNMPAAETGELEPVSWELFQTARLEEAD